MNRVNLLSPSMMTPAERAAGRFMRAPDGHESDAGGFDIGGGTPPVDSNANQNNGQGNSGDSQKDDQNQNNTRPADPTEGFWDKTGDENAAPDDSGERGKAVGLQLNQMIESAQFKQVFTKEIADAIADGNLDSVNAAMASSMQDAMRQSIGVFGQLMKAVIDKQNSDFDARIQKALGGSKANDALETHFPAAKDPTVRPVIQRVYDQALVNSNGNIDSAVQLTKSMLKAFGTKTGLTQAPSDPDGSSDNSRDLVNELLGRS